MVYSGAVDIFERRVQPDHRRRTSAQTLCIQLLGTFQVTVDGVAVAEQGWRLQKARTLLKLLALAPNHRLTREQLIDQLWPNLDPEAAANNLYRTLHAARRALGDSGDPAVSMLHLHRGVLELRPQGDLSIDVETFETASAHAFRTNDPAAYQSAVDLYTGELLLDDRYEDWAAARRDALRDTHIRLLLSLARIQEERGALAPAVEALDRLVQIEPADEEANVALMRLYARAGQRGRALRQYSHLRDALSRDLDIEPDPASRRLYAEILSGRYPPAEEMPPTLTGHADQAPQDNLPVSLTSFIGRKRDLAELRARLETARLLTLTGVGGVGKTRLALEVARAARDNFPDGVWWVELAGLNDPGLVPNAVAAALALPEERQPARLDTLAEALRPRTVLIVLDNCVHLLEACARLAERLLSASKGLRILATSREPFHVPGELVWRVLPLKVPDPDLPANLLSPMDEQVDSVRLFLDRARLARPGFRLTKRNAAAVAQICYRLDGIPLALELGATWISVWSPQQLAARLDDALGLLRSAHRSAPTRQQTLRATLDWSYRLLVPKERILLRRLAVFAGDWGLEPVETVCAGPSGARSDNDEDIEESEVLGLVAHLVDKSLIQLEERFLAESSALHVRYRLLETVRQYAGELLAAAGETEHVHDRHADYYLSLAEEAGAALAGPDQIACLERLEREHGNLREALRWLASRGDVERRARLCASIYPFWQIHGHLTEGSKWLEDVLAQVEEDALPVVLRASLLRGAGTLAESRGDPARAVELLRLALALFRQLGDQWGTAATLRTLGTALQHQDSYDEAAHLYDESLSLSEALDDRQGLAETLLQMGNVARCQGDRNRAVALLERSLTLHRELGNRRGTAMALGSLGVVASHGQEFARAEVFYTEALRLFQALGDKRFSAATLNNLAVVALSRGQYRRGVQHASTSFELSRVTGDNNMLAFSLEALARAAALARDSRRAGLLFGTAEALRSDMKMPGPPVNSFARHLEDVRANVDEAVFTAAWDVGRVLPLEEGLAEAQTIGEEFASDSLSSRAT